MFFNMFGEGIKLVLKALALGKVVSVITVFGICVAAHKHKYSQFLRLDIDFECGTCYFQRCATTGPFTDLFNNVIHVLDE